MNEQIVALLMEKGQEFISGEELSRRLNCSRTAIWKHIQALKEEGYEFEAIPRRGYRLKQIPARMNVEDIRSGLQTERIGKEIRYLDKVVSTQNEAHQWVSEGADEGVLVIAEQQTSGRGRMGRTWHSPAGKGIWMSLVLKPVIPLPLTSQLTLLVAVALCRAIRKRVKVEAGIKWPNDLLIDGKKVSGILLESSAEDERLRYVVVGVGISVNLNPQDYDEDLKKVATSLKIQSGGEVNREQLITTFLNEFEYLYELFQEQGFAPIKLLWEALSVTLHREIEIRTANGRVQGIASKIDEMGALVVQTADGQEIKLYSGDVEIKKRV